MPKRLMHQAMRQSQVTRLLAAISPVTGTTTHTGAVTFSGGVASGATITSPTITSPVINGTPTGWKLKVDVSATISINTAVDFIFLSLIDGSTIVETVQQPAAVASPVTASLTWAITGDGNSHTVKLQYKTNNAARSMTVDNSSATRVPTMTFLLTPSN
jgi:hypothetical protein